MFHRTLAIIPLLLLSASLAFGQDASITGTVSEGGRPIVGAPVTADDATLSAITNQDGVYTLAVNGGSHKVKVNLHGYKADEKTVQAASGGDPAKQDFALEALLQIVSVTAPASIAQGGEASVKVVVKNNGTSTYSLDEVSLTVVPAAGSADPTADFTTTPGSGNPATVDAGQSVTLSLTLTASGKAAPGAVTLRASILAFDTALGKNLLPNGSFEKVDSQGTASNWAFGLDGPTVGSGSTAADSGITGKHSAKIVVTDSSGDRAYYSNPLPISASTTYVLSGYLRTNSVEPKNEQGGAAVYAPITGNDPYQQPGSPGVTGTKDWRKVMVSIVTTENGQTPTAHSRAQLQMATGTAWFDNLSLTQGDGDGSLTVTGGDQPLSVTAAAVAAPTLKSPLAGALVQDNPPTLTWEAVAGAASYDVEIAVAGAFSSPVEKGNVTTTSFTPSKAVPMGPVSWRVRANVGGNSSGWVEAQFVQSYKPGVTISAIGADSIAAGGTGVVTLRVSNADSFAYKVDAAGVAFTQGGKDVSSSYEVVPDAGNAASIAAASTTDLKLNVTAAAGAPSSGVTLTGNLFLFNAGVGVGTNLASNPSLEIGTFDEAGLPDGWSFGEDAPSVASHFWVRDVFLSGNRSVRMEKTQAGNQSYIQPTVPADQLKPNTTYTVSLWCKTQDIPDTGDAGLLSWWNDGSGFKPSSPIPKIHGTQDWTYMAATFSTAEAQPTTLLPRGNVFADPGGMAWFDNFAVSEGVVDGAVTVRGGSGSLGQPISTPSRKKGDVNGDNSVNVKDLIALLRIIVGLDTPADTAPADVDGNGKVGITDALLLLKYVAGLITTLP
ncbi:MAG TPA: carboxypeptidase regulatory-like domain-containing protein [Armatimonadota bacterium]|jgi:hypothetical protein